MNKFFRWVFDNILFLILLFLLAFIPLYPKKPLLDVVNTWVYIRAEDFVVFSVLLVWLSLLIRKKITLKTPLTMPIILFWIVGSLATIHGVLLIFPEISNVFPNVAFLSMLRRIEYLSVFFVAYAAIKDKRVIYYIVGVIAITLLLVSLYGLGQKYLGFPAYLTMNEEFAKGEPIRLSALSRIPSTFAGHYDLAAYLVLVIPILASMLFGFRNWFVRLFFIVTIGLGFVVLFMTVSRVSFFVLLVSLAGVFFFHKKKWVIFSLPVVAVVFVFLFMSFSSSLLDRFGNTVKEIDVLVDAKTGEALGNVKEVTAWDFKDKVVKKRYFQTIGDIDARPKDTDNAEASSSALVPFKKLPETSAQLIPPNASTGENLPQGTGYINLSLSPVKRHLNEFFYIPKNSDGTDFAEVQMFAGDFLIKRASAYDLSFTTRFQGEWPHAIEAFKRNVFLGSGYGSISLAIDNNYLRILGEIGLLGFVAFFVIFIAAGMYAKMAWSTIDSPVVRSFVVGFAAGVVGLALNATLIDVFEASKVAFYLWLLMGLTMGILHHYQTKHFNIYHVLKKAAISNYAIIIYLAAITLVMFGAMISNYFVGDDFTWLRWVADCGGNVSHLQQCPSVPERILHYFTQSDGFFYRPGTKLYFLVMYSLFWLNPVSYHITSLVLHYVVVVLVFLLAKKILRGSQLAVLAAFLFAVLSGYSEAIFWIASIGHIFSVMFVLLSLLLFIYWDEKKKLILFILSLLSMGASVLFHELGVVAPLLVLLYKFTHESSFVKAIKSNRTSYVLLFLPVVLYLVVRALSNSHWSGGDYSYNLVKLPFNVVGNALGYSMLSAFGPLSLSLYEHLRNAAKDHVLFSIVAVLAFAGLGFLLYRLLQRMEKEDRRLVVFGIGFMLISLLPFLGLGNITSRYNYLVSFGFVILFVFLIKKLYGYLLSSGRDVAIGMVTVLLSIFFLLHIIQVQKIHGDWHDAGKKVNKMFISLEGLYENYWSTESMKLYFVNMPIRSGEAWVFPVGLEDALWFIFENPKVRTSQSASVEQALDAQSNPMLERVFLFSDNGEVTEKHRTDEEFKERYGIDVQN